MILMGRVVTREIAGSNSDPATPDIFVMAYTPIDIRM